MLGIWVPSGLVMYCSAGIWMGFRGVGDVSVLSFFHLKARPGDSVFQDPSLITPYLG